MPLGSLFEFLESHHVDWPHGVQPGAHFAVDLVFYGQLLASGDRNGGVRHQLVALNAKFVQAALRHVLRVRLQLCSDRGKFSAAVARLVKQLTSVVQRRVDLSQPGAHLFGLELQQAVTRLAGIALRVELHQGNRDLLILRLPLHCLGRRRLDLRPQRLDARNHFKDQGFNSLEPGGRRAMAFFEGRHSR